MAPIERRKYPRSKPPPGLGLRCTAAENAPGGALANLADRVIDISAKGIRIEASRRLPEGTLLHIEIVPPQTRTPVNVRAIVRWWRSFEEQGRQAHLAGLEFDRVIEVLGVKGGDPLLLEVLHDLRMAISQLRLYPKGSPQALRAVTETFQSVHSYLESREHLSLARAGRDLLVNGQPLPSTGSVSDSLREATLGLLAEAQVRSMIFKKGLTLEELGGFLHALTHKFWDLREGREINRRLREERIHRISVDEVQYVAVGEGDLVIEDAARKLAARGTDVAKLMAELDRIVEAASGEGLGTDGRLEIVKRLLEKDPTLLERIRAIPSAGGGGAASAGAAAGILDFDRAREIVAELASLLLPEVPSNVRARLRNLGRAIAGTFREDRPRKELEALLPAEEAEKPRESPEASRPAPAVAGALSRAQAIQNLPLEEKLQAIGQEGPALVDELAALGEKEIIHALATSTCEPLSDPVPRRRSLASRALAALQAALEKHAEEKTLREMRQRILAALDAEREASSYQGLADLAVFLADLSIRRGALAQARPLIDLLRRHYHIKDEHFPARAELAYGALQRLTTKGGMAGLSDRLRRGDAEATGLVEALDAAAAGLLVREARSSETAAQRQQYARLLSRLGRGGASVLLEEIQKITLPADLLRLIELVPLAMPADLAELALAPLLRHEAATVRRRAAQTLADQGYPRAGASLLGALEAEKDPAIRALIVEGLGRLRAREAVEPLCQILQSRQEADEVRAAAAHALGRIGDPRAAPVLVRTYGRREKGLTVILRAPVPSAVRAAAARALAAFPGDREARDALRRAREDRDSAVRSAAALARYTLIQDVFGDLATGAEVVGSPDEAGSSPGKTAGALEEIPLDPLLRRLAAREKTGTLVLHYRGGSTGRIHFDAGMITAVEFENRPDAEAFTVLARRREGHFLFLPGASPLLRRILAPVDSLLEAAERSAGG